MSKKSLNGSTSPAAISISDFELDVDVDPLTADDVVTITDPTSGSTFTFHGYSVKPPTPPSTAQIVRSTLQSFTLQAMTPPSPDKVTVTVREGEVEIDCWCAIHPNVLQQNVLSWMFSNTRSGKLSFGEHDSDNEDNIIWTGASDEDVMLLKLRWDGASE